MWQCRIFEARLLRLNWICWTFVLGRQSLLSSQHHLVKTELGTQTWILFRFAPQLHRLWEFRQARRWTESSHFSIEQRIWLVGRQRPQGERKRRAFPKRSSVSPILDVPRFRQLVKFRELARLPRRLTSSTAAFSTKLVVQVSKLRRIDKLPCFSKLLRWRLLDALVSQYLHLSISQSFANLWRLLSCSSLSSGMKKKKMAPVQGSHRLDEHPSFGANQWELQANSCLIKISVWWSLICWDDLILVLLSQNWGKIVTEFFKEMKKVEMLLVSLDHEEGQGKSGGPAHPHLTVDQHLKKTFEQYVFLQFIVSFSIFLIIP